MVWSSSATGKEQAKTEPILPSIKSQDYWTGGIGEIVCREALQNISDHNEDAKMLIKAINDSSCDSLKKGLVCDFCSKQGTHQNTVAYYSADDKKITLCHNRVDSKQNMEDNVIHELVHAYDNCKQDKFFLDCKLRACSEIRASRIGECRGRWDRANCVRESALSSTKIYCENAESFIAEAFESCYKDVAPLTKQQASKKTRES